MRCTLRNFHNTFLISELNRILRSTTKNLNQQDERRGNTVPVVDRGTSAAPCVREEERKVLPCFYNASWF